MELRKWQLSEALSYAHLAPLASVYCPMAPPALRAAAPHMVLPLRTAFQVGAIASSFAVAASRVSCAWHFDEMLDGNLMSKLTHEGLTEGHCSRPAARSSRPLTAPACRGGCGRRCRQARWGSRQVRTVLSAPVFSWWQNQFPRLEEADACVRGRHPPRNIIVKCIVKCCVRLLGCRQPAC